MLPILLDWLESIENDNDSDMLIHVNFLNMICYVLNILNAAINVMEHGSIYDLNPNELIVLLLGYR